MGREWLEGRRKIKQAKVEGEIKVVEARTEATIEYAKTEQGIRADWNKLSIENAGWKDEWFTILLSIPMVLCFIPGGAQYVEAGFTALRETTPEWYQYAFLVAVASSFGFKKLADIRRK
jgi:hypothetical protein